MVVYNFARQSSFALDQGASNWDPSTILGIINPDKRKFTCVGYAPSCGRRCRKEIAQSNQQKVFDMLNEIALLSPHSRAVASKLPKIAFLSLCVRYHWDQVEEMVSTWQTKISSMKPRAARVKSWRVDEDDAIQNTTPRCAASRPGQKIPPASSPHVPRASARIRPTQAEKEQRRKEEQDKKRREQEELAAEKLKKEKEEKEEKEKLAREKKQKKEKQERERQAENERMRRAAERAREEKERLKRAEAAREKKELAEAWEKYIGGWDTFRGMLPLPVFQNCQSLTDFPAATESIPTSSVRSAIPWPVRGGQYSEVRYTAVKDFYLKACPEADNATAMFKIMQKESLKWHPDKICSLFRGAAVGEADKMVVDVIAKVVIELRADAQKKRKP